MKWSRSFRLFFCCGLFFLVAGWNMVLAQQTDLDARRAELQAQLEAEEKAIAFQTELLRAKQRDTATVAGEVSLLKSQIAQSQASIKAKQVAISRLESDIALRQGKIETLSAKIKSEQASLAELLRHNREIEELTFVEIMLSNNRLSSIFRDVDDSLSIQKSLALAFQEMRATQEAARQEQAKLEGKKNAEIDAKQTIEEEKKRVEKNEADKRVLLALNQNQAKAYQKILTERQKRAAQIRAALFSLRDTAAIPFGKALEYATMASKKTGVRPAFLLAILKQESNLGENIGTCNRPGDPASKRWRAIMPGPGDKSSRDDESAYLRITRTLGLDPETMPLSCPWQGGWGGAMGPSQFIPTTWESYSDKIAAALSKSIANPWQPEDAFMASAIYLAELGADKASYTAERTAALKYYAGGAWAKAKNAFYGNEVMAKASDIQLNMIDPLQNN